MNHLSYLFLIFALCFIDQNVIKFIDLQVRRLELFLQSLPIRIRLRYEIFAIKQGWWDKKFEKMADEILKDLKDETDQV